MDTIPFVFSSEPEFEVMLGAARWLRGHSVAKERKPNNADIDYVIGVIEEIE